MASAIPAAAAAVGIAGAGEWLFSYNRENFQFDATLRFSRFMAARNFAIAQMGQYRQDVKTLIGATVMKMDTSQLVLTLFMTVCAFLSCAGRIGMHGSAPPQWLCALYSGHIFSALLYNGTGLFLSMHASLRAQCAMVSLLTRKVRLPMPSISQLDQARVFGSSFEKQNARDIFRVPFMRNTQNGPQAPPGSDDEDEDDDPKSAIDPKTEFASTTRDTVPSWIRDEQVVDKGNGHAGNGTFSFHTPHNVPEHFKLILKAQEEYWQYDIYARIMMLYGVCNYLHAISYYCIGTTISELRGFWIMWSMPMMFMAAQALIFRLDIVRGTAGQHCLPHAEWAGHVAPYIVVSACTLEYRLWYTTAGVFTTWALVFGAYFAHIVMALRMLDCAWPDWDRKDELPDEPAKSWWPSHWKVPSSFSQTMWFVAAPKRLPVGQHDLLQEMHGLAQSGGGIVGGRGGKSSAAGAGKEGHVGKVVTPSVLGSLTDGIDRSFQWWFEEGVWPQVPEAGQARLHELFAHFRALGREVNEITGKFGLEGEWQAGSGPGPQLTLPEVETKVAEIYGALVEVRENLADVETAHKPNMTVSFPEGDDAASSTVAKGRPHLPWQLVRLAISSVVFMWVYMVVVIIIELGVGVQGVMKSPGSPPWIRDTKSRNWDPSSIHFSDQHLPLNYNLFSAGSAVYVGNASGYVPTGASSVSSGLLVQGVPVPPNLNTNLVGTNVSGTTTPLPIFGGGLLGGLVGGTRRLTKNLNSNEMAMESLLDALPRLGWLIDTVQQMQTDAEPAAPSPPSSFMAAAARSAKVEWPSLFEPQHLSCAPVGPGVIAITSRGLGAIAHLSDEGTAAAKAFMLDGLAGQRIAGSSWTKEGLQVITMNGQVLECPGQSPANGIWACLNGAIHALPMSAGSRLSAAALNLEHPLGRMAALQLDLFPEMVGIFQHSEAQGWRPAGEVHMPPGTKGRLSLAFKGPELLVSSATGEVLRRHLVEGTSSWHSAPTALAGPSPREFQAICDMPAAGGMLRLALRRTGSGLGSAWGPEIIIGA